MPEPDERTVTNDGAAQVITDAAAGIVLGITWGPRGFCLFSSYRLACGPDIYSPIYAVVYGNS